MPHAKKVGKVNLHPVRSSHIEAIGHDPERQHLHMAFLNGKKGHHDNVDANTFRLFLAAPSKGKFYHKFIKSKPDLHVWHPHEPE